MEQQQLQTYATDKAFAPLHVTDNSDVMAKNAADLNQSMEVYGQMQRQNDQTKINNAKQSGDGLVALSKFSKKLGDHLIKEKQQQNQRDLEEGIALAYTEGVSPESQQLFDSEEAALIETDSQIREVGGQLPESTLPDVRRGVSNLSGWKGYGFAQGMAQKGAAEYPMVYQQLARDVEVTVGGKAITLNTATSAPERAAVEGEIRRRFLQQYAGMNTNLLAKYLFPQMRKYEYQQQMEWVEEQDKLIKAERKDEALNFLYNGIQGGRGGESVVQFIDQFKGDFGGRGKAWEQVTDSLGTLIDEGKLTRTQLEDIKSSTVTIDGKEVKIGNRWARRFAGLDEKLDAAERKPLQDAWRAQEDAKKKYQLEFQAATKEKHERGDRWTDDELAAISEKWFPGQQPPTWISNYQTTEEQNVDAVRTRLNALRQSRTFLVESDLNNIPAELYREFKGYVEEDRPLASYSNSEETDAKNLINSYATTITKQSGKVDKSPIWHTVSQNANRFYKDRRAEYIRSGSTKQAAHTQAMADTKDGFMLDEINEGKKNAWHTAYAREDQVKNDTKAIAMVAEAKKAVVASGGSLLTSRTEVIPGTEDALSAAQKYVDQGVGEIPQIYRILAESAPGVTGYDVMMNQLAAQGAQVELPTPNRDVINDAPDPELQRLLKFKVTPSRLNRAFLQSTATSDALMNMIISKESASYGTWDAFNQGGSDGGHTAHGSGNSATSSPWGKPVSQMSLAEIRHFQSLPIGHPKVLHAAGAFQFIGSTFNEVSSALGLDENTVFTPEVQMMFFRERLRWRMKVDPGLAGLRREWIGLTNVSDNALQNTLVPYYQQPQNMLAGVTPSK